MDIETLPTTITTSTGAHAHTFTVAITAQYITVASGTFLDATQPSGPMGTWTVADSINVTSFSISPVENFTFPIVLTRTYAGPENSIGYLTIDTSGMMSINQSIEMSAIGVPDGFLPFCIQFAYL